MENNFIIIVPLYNGAGYIEQFYRLIPAKFRAKLLFVDDGSTDTSREILVRKNLNFISHPVNRGKGAALITGANYAAMNGIENMIIMDIDLQHPPELTGRFTSFGNNLIQIAYRRQRKTMPIQRKISNFLTSLFISVRTNTVIKDSQCGFRAYPTGLAQDLEISAGGFQYESEILMRAALKGYRIVHREIPVVYDAEPTQMNNVTDTLKFMNLWFRSFFW